VADDNKNSVERNKLQREYNELLKEEGRIQAEREGRTASDIYTRESVNNAASLTSYAQQLTEDAKEQAGYTRSKAEADKKLVSLARQLSTSATNITAELGREAEVLKQIQSDRKLQRNIEIELANARAQLSDQEAAAATKLAELGAKRAKQQTILGGLQERLRHHQGIMGTLTGKEFHIKKKLVDKLQQQFDKQKTIAEQADLDYETTRDTVGEAEEKVANLEEQFDLSTKLIADREAELKTQKEITKATGVTGAVVEGIGGIMQRLGLRSGIFNQAMADASNEMRRIAGDAKKAKQEISKTQVAVAGMAKLLGGLKGGLLDPAVIGGAVLKSFFEVNSAATELQRITGQESSEIAGMNDRLATSVDFLQVAAELTAQTGMNAQNAFSPNVIAQAAELKNTMGLTAEAAGGLATIAQTTVGDVDGVTASVVGTTSAFNKANRSAVSQGVVLRDVAHAAADIKASFSGNPEQLALAATAARRMGLELSKVDQIASSLMDFESSIEAELEAQLLTGKSINMAKARELALNNDLAGLGKEIFKNSADLNEFGKMNLIQQEAQAKALGISREELGKIAYARAIETGMTEEAAEAAAGVTAEDMKRLKAQESLQLAVNKLTQAFAPVLNIIGDIANGLATMISPVAKLVGLITSTGIGKVAVATFVAMRAFGGLNNVIGGTLGGIKNLTKNFGDYVKKVISSKGPLEKAKAFLGMGDKTGGITKDAQGRFRDAKGRFAKAPASAAKKLSDSAKKMPKGTGGASKGTSSLTDAISKIDPKKLLAGAAAMVIAAGAVFIFAKATQEFMKVTWGAVGKAIVSLVALVGAVALLSLFVSGPQALALLAGAAAMLIVAGALFVLGKAVQEIGKGMESLGKGIDSELITNLLSLGPALGSAAKGLALFGGAMALGGIGALIGGGMITQLQTLAGLSSPLSTVGSSLTAIAAGIVAIAAALNTLETEKLNEIKDLVMTTALAAPMIAASGAITSLINGITGGGEGDSNSELLAEIKALRAVVEKGGNINMDGNKVGQFIMLSANKSA